MSELKKAVVIFSYQLNATCPHCDNVEDLLLQDDEGIYTEHVFNNKPRQLEGMKLNCSNCEEDFLIDYVEYE